MRTLLSILICFASVMLHAGRHRPPELPDWAFEQIESDLEPFANGITRGDLDSWLHEENGVVVFERPYLADRPSGMVRIQITNNQMRVINTVHAGGVRLNCVTSALNAIIQSHTLPDLDFLVCLEDGLDLQIEGPIFCFAKSKDVDGLLWPDFEMMCGYSCFEWPLEHWFSEELAWQHKTKAAVWRGSTSGQINSLTNWSQSPRARLVRFSVKRPELLDARFTDVVQADVGVRGAMADAGMLGGWLGIDDQMRWAYVVDVDGNSCCYSRTYWILRSHCVPLKVRSKNIQWFYAGLKPWVHYVPIQRDYSDLAANIDWLRDHDEEARKIGRAGHKFAVRHLSPSSVQEYMYALLVAYAELYTED